MHQQPAHAPRGPKSSSRSVHKLRWRGWNESSLVISRHQDVQSLWDNFVFKILDPFAEQFPVSMCWRRCVKMNRNMRGLNFTHSLHFDITPFPFIKCTRQCLKQPQACPPIPKGESQFSIKRISVRRHEKAACPSPVSD